MVVVVVMMMMMMITVEYHTQKTTSTFFPTRYAIHVVEFYASNGQWGTDGLIIALLDFMSQGLNSQWAPKIIM